MKNLKILYIEDDKDNRDELIDLLTDYEVNDCKITIDGEESFERAIQKLNENKYHLVILDLFEGRAIDEGKKAGLKTLDDIKGSIFIPIIFYSGNTAVVKDLRSQVIGIATKGEGGVEELQAELQRLTANKLPFITENVLDFINRQFRLYFWSLIQEERSKFTPENNDHSLGYLLLRNISDSLTRKNIYKILDDQSINNDKIHPMEFYIYPRIGDIEYENGEIVVNNETNDVYIILTPSCDFILRYDKKKDCHYRKANNILLAKAEPLTITQEYSQYQSKFLQQNNAKDERSRLSKVIECSKSDRYFFLPGTPFIENRVVDFQDNMVVTYENLTSQFTRLAKLDSPFAQSMTASFIRYYNRIGFPDIDTEYVIRKLEESFQ